MRRVTILSVFVCLLWLPFSAAGQNKYSATAQCAKPTVEHKLEIGDRPGHVFSITQGTCTYTTPATFASVQTKEGKWTGFDEVSGNISTYRGVNIDVLSNGDKIFGRYEGSATSKNGKLVSGEEKWTLAGGTGKFKNIKGTGTCKGKGNPDGSSTWECSGDYQLSAK